MDPRSAARGIWYETGGERRVKRLPPMTAMRLVDGNALIARLSIEAAIVKVFRDQPRG